MDQRVMKISERNYAYDVARAIAIMLVVLCHCLEQPFTFDITDWEQMSLTDNLFRIMAHSLSGSGVPFFFFLSGALILSKKIEKDEDIWKFYKNNLMPLFSSTVIWVVIYRIYLWVSIDQTVTAWDWVKQLLLIDQIGKMIHMWYMPVIIGIYISLPFVAKVVKTFSVRAMWPVFAFIYVLTSIIPTVNEFLMVKEIPVINADWNAGFTAGVYGLYIVLGYYISRGLLRKWKVWQCWLVALICYGGLVVMHLYIFARGYKYKIWYGNSMLIIIAVMLFELVIRHQYHTRWFIAVTRYLSKISLAIYFIHLPVIKTLNLVVETMNISRPAQVILLWCISVPLSVEIIWVASRIKWIKKYVLLIK